MEIDLHDKTTDEAITFFIEKYNKAIKNNYKFSIYVIHGYGSSGKGGKIKKVFHNYLKENSQYLEYEFNSNPGVVIVYPKRPSSGIPEFFPENRIQNNKING
jgi:dsDNA-specific endonuclease/ATPase MutS2